MKNPPWAAGEGGSWKLEGHNWADQGARFEGGTSHYWLLVFVFFTVGVLGHTSSVLHSAWLTFRVSTRPIWIVQRCKRNLGGGGKVEMAFSLVQCNAMRCDGTALAPPLTKLIPHCTLRVAGCLLSE